MRGRRACARILTSERYGQLDITEQLGLIPLGPSPASGLEEFLHWETHERGTALPTRSEEGRLQLTAGTGLVFVLIPGGTFRMGAERPASPDARGPNLDPNATPHESPAHDVTLSPYFISKYEMTQAQWSRAMRTTPSNYLPGTNYGGKKTTQLHPVEQVSWNDCRHAMERLGLLLPTEAQWERSARGGRGNIWSCGDDRSALDEYDNLADAYGVANGFPAELSHEKDLNDGRTIHAPVGTYAPNSFGLFDVGGNVREWCRDRYTTYGKAVAEGDGERSAGTGSRYRVNRGGCFDAPAVHARVASRDWGDPSFRDYVLGCRPSRAIH